MHMHMHHASRSVWDGPGWPRGKGPGKTRVTAASSSRRLYTQPLASDFRAEPIPMRSSIGCVGIPYSCPRAPSHTVKFPRTAATIIDGMDQLKSRPVRCRVRRTGDLWTWRAPSACLLTLKTLIDSNSSNGSSNVSAIYSTMYSRFETQALRPLTLLSALLLHAQRNLKCKIQIPPIHMTTDSVPPARSVLASHAQCKLRISHRWQRPPLSQKPSVVVIRAPTIQTLEEARSTANFQPRSPTRMHCNPDRDLRPGAGRHTMHRHMKNLSKTNIHTDTRCRSIPCFPDFIFFIMPPRRRAGCAC